jgi:5-hydroxyisourate hydrolase-like protein (transthyretin family)
MTKRMHALTLLVVGCASFAGAQQRSGASVLGQVRTASGQPVSGVRVVLREPSVEQVVKSLVTNSDGEFRFDGVPDSRYLLFLSKRGYVQDDRVREGATLDTVVVRDGKASPAWFSVEMAPQAAIEGTVVDKDGDPVAGLLVFAFRYDREGPSFRLSQRAWGRTDDRGKYRIPGLTSGRYYVAAKKLLFPPDRMQSEVIVPTFYPGEARFSKAAPVDLQPGDDRLDVNIQVRMENAYHIRGIALDGSRNPVRKAEVEAFPSGPDYEDVAAPGRLQQAIVETDDDGRFDIGGLPPGTYIVRGLGNRHDVPSPDISVALGAGVGPEAGASYGVAGAVTIGGGDVDGIVLQLLPPSDLKGRVHVEDGTPIAGVELTFQAEPFSDAKMLHDFWTKSGSDGNFLFPKAWITQFTVSVSGLPRDAFLKTLKYGGKESFTTIDHTGSEKGTLEVVLASSAATLSGTVRNETGIVANGVQVFAWPRNPRSADDFSGVFTDRDGRYSIGNLAPGDYSVISVMSADIQLIRNPQFREAVTDDAIRVTLSASSKTPGIDLKVLAAERLREVISQLR